MTCLSTNPSAVPYFGQYYEFNKGLPELSKTRVPQLVIVPYWIQQLLARNKLNYIDLLDYNKIRSLMSIEDIATFMALTGNDDLRDSFLGRLNGIDNYIYYRYCERATVEQRKELDVVIGPLIQAESTYKTLIDRLSLDNPADKDHISSEDLYTLQVNNDGTIFLFVKKGILNALEDRDYAHQLVSAYLQALYGLAPIHDVSFKDAFKLYLALI
jgi:hypothetical protein